MQAILVIAALVIYPLAVHGLVVFDAPQGAVIGLVAVSLLNLLWLLRAKSAATPWLALYALLVATGLFNLYTQTVYALFIPPAAMNIGLMLLFGVSLRRGRQPLVEAMMRLEYGADLPAPLARYGRQLTYLWTGFFAAVAGISIVLAVFAPLAVWSFFVNILIYILITALFVLQYSYRYWRFRQYGVFLPWHLVQRLARTPISDPAHPFSAPRELAPAPK